MPGFFGFYGEHEKFKFDIGLKDRFVVENFCSGRLRLIKKTVNKFISDKVFTVSGDYFILLEGFILNKNELINTCCQNSWPETVACMYNKSGDRFMSEFRGSFSGLIKDGAEILLYTGQLGEKTVYYSKLKEGYVFGSDLNDLLIFYKKNGIKIKPYEPGMFAILSYGGTHADTTPYNDIYRIEPGTYIRFGKETLKKGRYHLFDYHPDESMKMKDAVEQVDFLFRKAVKSAFDKDREYGYKHLVSLSGGLDSRMTAWVAHDMGYDMLNVTFSQSDYIDEKVPKEIAQDMKTEWIFKSLDNGLYLKDIEEIIDINGGANLYSGSAHVNSMARQLNYEEYGIYHTGQLGDGILAWKSEGKQLNKKTITEAAYSKKNLHKTNDDFLVDYYKSYSSFLIYTRYFNITNIGLLPLINYTETWSPFYELEFFEFCLTIPESLRANHLLYYNWVLSKYPEACKYTYESLKRPIFPSDSRKKGKWRKFAEKAFIYGLARIAGKKYGMDTPNHMNPFDYWYKTNENLREFIESYYLENIDKTGGYPEIKNALEEQMKTGTTNEKLQVLSILAMFKQYELV